MYSPIIRAGNQMAIFITGFLTPLQPGQLLRKTDDDPSGLGTHFTETLSAPRLTKLCI